MAEPLSAELFREAVAVAAGEAIRDGKDFSRLSVSRIDAIISDLKKHTQRGGLPPASPELEASLVPSHLATGG